MKEIRNTILIYGTLSGLAIALLMGIGWNTEIMNNSYGEVIGFTSMIAAFSLIFIGINQYKKNTPGKKVGFLEALIIGLSISFIASIFYIVTWGLVDGFSGGEFIEKYEVTTLSKLEKEGASEETITEAKESLNYYTELYKNPYSKMLLTFMEIFPVGILVSVVAGLFFWIKDKNKPYEVKEGASI